MAYTPTNWQDLPSKQTLVTATRLNNMENGILNADQNKVDKVTGKGLSTNDYTTTEKNKLSGLNAPVITGTQIEF